MKGRIFLIHWNTTEAKVRAKELRTEGWQVEVETMDGARAYKKIRANPPDVVVIDLSRLPSHGQETADAFRSLKATRDIPIIFVDGTAEGVAKIRAKVKGAVFTTATGLHEALAKFAK